jgi:hypothetical protein
LEKNHISAFEDGTFEGLADLYELFVYSIGWLLSFLLYFRTITLRSFPFFLFFSFLHLVDKKYHDFCHRARRFNLDRSLSHNLLTQLSASVFSGLASLFELFDSGLVMWMEMIVT